MWPFSIGQTVNPFDYDSVEVCHCTCGRYTPKSTLTSKGWRAALRGLNDIEVAYTCPECIKFKARARMRLIVTSGKKPSEWTAEERAIAAQMMGDGLVQEAPSVESKLTSARSYASTLTQGCRTEVVESD